MARRKRTAHTATGDASLYQGVAPDNSVLQMYSGRVSEKSAYMLVSSWRGGCWYPDMVSACALDVQDAQGFKFACIKCVRVK